LRIPPPEWRRSDLTVEFPNLSRFFVSRLSGGDACALIPDAPLNLNTLVFGRTVGAHESLLWIKLAEPPRSPYLGVLSAAVKAGPDACRGRILGIS
jgi:hypothetical protein